MPTDQSLSSSPHHSPATPIRRSTRPHKPPSHLQDYVCKNSTTHWCNFVNFYTFPAKQQALIASQSVWREPCSYKDASLSDAWQESMNAEFLTLQNNNTRDLRPLPPGKKAIGCK